jgi:RNA polymerase sigma-70 factor (ECF subfamily)
MVLSSSLTTAQRDRQLIQRISNQEQNALLELYQRYGSLVYGLALRILRNPGAAEEVVQDIFLKVWQSPERWNPNLGQFSSWLLTITRNASIDRLRKDQHLQFYSLEQVEVAPTAALDDHIWYDAQILANLLLELPFEQRQLIELAFYQGYTHSELSENLRLPLGTIKTRLRTGLQKLRSLWEKSVK